MRSSSTAGERGRWSGGRRAGFSAPASARQRTRFGAATRDGAPGPRAGWPRNPRTLPLRDAPPSAGRRQEVAAAAGEVVAGGEDRDLAGLHGVGDDRAGGGESLRGAAGVAADGVVGLVRRLGGAFRGRRGGSPRGSWRCGLKCGRRRARRRRPAWLVADDEREGGVARCAGVFAAGDGGLVRGRAGVAQDEKVAEAPVEIERGSDARAGAGAHDGAGGPAWAAAVCAGGAGGTVPAQAQGPANSARRSCRWRGTATAASSLASYSSATQPW